MVHMDEIIYKPEGVDTPEEKAKYEGTEVILITDSDKGTRRKILKSFWSTPCGYWTQCFLIEGYGYIMRSQVYEFCNSSTMASA